MSDDFEKDDNLELNDEEQQLENDATGSESNDSEATNEPENERRVLFRSLHVAAHDS